MDGNLSSEENISMVDINQEISREEDLNPTKTVSFSSLSISLF